MSHIYKQWGGGGCICKANAIRRRRISPPRLEGDAPLGAGGLKSVSEENTSYSLQNATAFAISH